MKKLLSILLGLFMVAGIASCNSPDPDPDPTPDPTPTTEKTISITPSNYKTETKVSIKDCVDNTSYTTEFTVKPGGVVASNGIKGITKIDATIFGTYENHKVYASSDGTGTALTATKVQSGSNVVYTYTLSSDTFYFVNSDSSHNVGVVEIKITYTGDATASTLTLSGGSSSGGGTTSGDTDLVDVTKYTGKCYTPDELYLIIAALEDNGVSTEIYQVKGKVKSVDYNSTYKSYYIEFEGTNTVKLYSVQLASGLTAPKVGQEVTCTGYLKKRVKNGTTTYEMAYIQDKNVSPVISAVTGEEKQQQEVTLTPVGTKQNITISFTTADKETYRTTMTTTQQVWESDGLKITNDKDGSTNNIGDYPNSDYAGARFYKSSKVTVEYSSPIKSIIWEGTTTNSSGNTAYLGENTVIQGATLTASGAKTLIVFETPTTSFSFNCLAQVRIVSIEVYC